jgi:hypothetical protein
MQVNAGGDKKLLHFNITLISTSGCNIYKYKKKE